MILYHFTALARLIGEDGLSELHKAWDVGAPEAINAAAFAAPGSILKSGIKPMQDMDWPTLGLCVWLTTNPDMSNDFVTGNALDRGNWRVTVVIPSTDRRLVYLPKYFSKRTGGDYVISSEDRAHAYRLAREATGFYFYFGAIPLDRSGRLTTSPTIAWRGQHASNSPSITRAGADRSLYRRPRLRASVASMRRSVRTGTSRPTSGAMSFACSRARLPPRRRSRPTTSLHGGSEIVP